MRRLSARPQRADSGPPRSPCRSGDTDPTLEAAAGKNPVTHTGKLYNLLAERMARALVGEIPGVEAAQCYLLRRIGAPIDRP